MSFASGTISLAGAATAVTLAGVQLERTVELPNHALELASCGVRDSLWIEHYAAGLYLPPGAPIEAAADPGTAKAVRIKFVQTRYLPEEVPVRWRGALERALPSERMLRVRELYGRLSDGDEVAITYAPRDGVSMLLNGRRVLQSGGHAVIDAVLDAWARGDDVPAKLARLAREHPC